MNNTSTGENDTRISEVSVAFPDGDLIYNAYLVGTITFGGPGNLLVLLIYLKSGPISSTDWFIIFISIYDLISSLISVPVYLTFSTGTWRHYGNDVICKFHMFVSQSAVLSSTFLICGLAIERYYKVCRPESTSFTRARSKRICVAISAVATVLSLPCFVLFHNEQMRCGSVTEGLLVKLLMAYYTGMLLSFLSAVIVLIFTYSRIAMTTLRSQINMLRHDKDQFGNQIKTKHRFGAFLTLCCRKNKIHPHTSRNLSNAEPGPSGRPTERVVEGSSEDKIVYLNHIGSTHGTENNENEAELIEKGIEKFTVTHELNSRESENGVTVNHITSRQREDDTTAKERLELPRIRRAFKLPRIHITHFTEIEAHRSVLDTDRDQHIESLEQTAPRSMRITVNSQFPKTVQRINENRRLRRSLKTTRIVFCICLIFVLSWIPPWASFISFIVMSPTSRTNPTYLEDNMFCRMTYLINTFSNPMLYTALNTTFREKVKKFLCRR